MEKFAAVQRLALLWALAVLAWGCSPVSNPTASELPIHRLETVTDRAEVEKLALEVIPGARPLPGDAGLLALQADGLIGVAITPEGWAGPGPQLQSTDMMLFLLSIPAEHKRFREPLLKKLRDAVAARSGHTPTRPGLVAPFVLQVGGSDHQCQKIEAITVNRTPAVEYWLDLPQGDRSVFIVAAGLAGFANFFPDQRLAEFLKQLPKAQVAAPSSK